MGLAKQYLRYVPSGIFGVVAAKTCNAVFLQPNRFIVTGGTHVVTMWDTRLQRKVKTMECDSSSTTLKPNSDYTVLAVGQQNGAVGLYDLKDKSDEANPKSLVTFEGHLSDVTCLAWDDADVVLASGGKDTKIILWDCVSEAGITKFKGHKGVVTQIRFWNNGNGKYLVSSSKDSSVKIWDMVTYQCIHTIPSNTAVYDFDIWDNIFVIAESGLHFCKIEEDPKCSTELIRTEIGNMSRNASGRISEVHVVNNTHIISISSKSNAVEVFKIKSKKEPVASKKKRSAEIVPSSNKFSVVDLVERGKSLKASEDNLKSIDCIYDARENSLKLLFCLPTNQVEVINVPLKDPELENVSQLSGFDGHRKMVRAITFSSDKTAMLTASADSFKIWNRPNLSCILTIPHQYQIVSAAFCPGDRHFIAGSTCGHILLVDISIGKIIKIESTGEETVWGIDVYPNNLGFAAINGNLIQFFDFAMSDGKLTFVLKKQLDVSENILCLKISPNMRFIATGLLDSTIKVFYFDTLKFHLAMYGHSMPVVGIDISSEGSLLTSCSADKSVRVWGMDFGDIHSSWIGGEGLVGCKFIEKSHHLVAVGKDSIHFYDADSHERIQTIKAHIEGGATCMATAGVFVVSAGRDQALRFFNRTEEILVLDDEREREREIVIDKESNEEKDELTGLKTADSEKYADKIIEALDLFDEKAETNQLMTAFGAKNYKEFVLKTLMHVKASELEQSVMLLPVGYVNKLILAITEVLESFPLSTETAIRALQCLMKFHFSTLSFAERGHLEKLTQLVEKRVKDLGDMVGFNLAGLRFIQATRNDFEDVQAFREIFGNQNRKRKMKVKATKRAILTISTS